MRRFFLMIIVMAFGKLTVLSCLQGESRAFEARPEKELWEKSLDTSFHEYLEYQARTRFLSALDHLKQEKRLSMREVQTLVAVYETCSRLEEFTAEKYLKDALSRLLEDEKNAKFLEGHLLRLWKDTGYLALTKKPIYHDPNGWYRNFQKASSFEKRWMIDTVALETQAALVNGYLVQEQVERLDPQLLVDMQYRAKVKSKFLVLSPILLAKRSPVRVIRGDLIDTACEVDEKGPNVLVVLGGQGLFPWKGALGIQQDLESLLERTTALTALDPAINQKVKEQLTPMNAFSLQESLLYLPHVSILRRSLGSGFGFNSLERLDFMITYQEVDGSLDVNSDLKEVACRQQVRSILRAAYQEGHRSLILSLSSLRVKGQGIEEMTQAWYDVLGEREFLGQFTQLTWVVDSVDESVLNLFNEKFKLEP